MSSPVAGTAIGPILAVAVEQNYPPDRRLITDDVAYRLLPRASKAAVVLTRFGPARELLIRLSDSDAPGIWGGMLRRKRFVDDKLAEALSDGAAAIVNLGAGLDTRAYRLPAGRAVPVFEVDQPENVEQKRGALLKAPAGGV